MKPIFGRITVLLTVLLLILLVVPLTSQAEVFEGDCGATAWWHLDTDTGVLTIYGSGAMKDYSDSSSSPWHNYYKNITEINVAPGIQSIGAYAFKFLYMTQKITLPDGLTSIGRNAFNSCGGLNITLPQSLTRIDRQAFYDSSIQHITLPSSLTYIDYNAFAYSQLKDIVIPEGVTSIGNHAFYDCRKLETVILPESLTYAGSGAFACCYALNHIVLPSALQTCNSVFVGSTSLVSAGPYGSGCSIEFAPMNAIPDYMFCYLPVTTFIVPEGTTSIGAHAFQYCSHLKQICLPQSLQSIGDSAFSSCSLSSLNIPSGVAYIGKDALRYCDSLLSLTIPGSITSVPYSLCYSCMNLKQVIFEEGVLEIMSDAFAYCSQLSTVILPHSLTSISRSSFMGCSQLWDVYYNGGYTEWKNVTNYDVLGRARFHGSLKVTMGNTRMSEDGKSIFIDRPTITGAVSPVTIAYNIYDSHGNAINYFYSDADAVAATCPSNGRYNVYIVVSEPEQNMSETLMTGWFDVTGYEEFDVSPVEWTLSPDGCSCFIFKPTVTGAVGKVSIAYNIYDNRGRPINYFYSDEKAVAATCPYNGRFNVFVVVKDDADHAKTVMTGWFDVTGCGKITSFEMPEIPDEWQEEWLQDDFEEDPAVDLAPADALPEQTRVEEITVMEYLGQSA